jgi:hypothetical protein
LGGRAPDVLLHGFIHTPQKCLIETDGRRYS